MKTNIGIDIADIAQFHFRGRLGQKKRFLESVFSESEREYCLSYKDSASHFAGTFAAKEAAKKASGLFLIPLHEFEIRRTKDGKPEVWLKGRRSRLFSVSITHSRAVSCAVALYFG